MTGMPRPDQKGQSAVEFVLLSPLLFFIFFGIIQFAYSAYVAFAVQRAAYAIAREAAACPNPKTFNPYFQLVYCLAPLGQLNNATLATALATKCDISVEDDSVQVRLFYPMPIWVPMVGKLFGEKLQLNPSNLGPVDSDLKSAFQLIGKPLPELSLQSLTLPYVHFIAFSATTPEEAPLGYQADSNDQT